MAEHGIGTERDALAALQAESARLIALLDANGIEWRLPSPPAQRIRKPEPSTFSTAETVALFRKLFRGRIDVYPVRWESKTTGKSGYAPACANEWRAGICGHDETEYARPRRPSLLFLLPGDVEPNF